MPKITIKSPHTHPKLIHTDSKNLADLYNSSTSMGPMNQSALVWYL